MIHKVFLGIIAAVLVAAVAVAQSSPPGSDDNRYQFNRVEDGFVRLDMRTGQVSLCSRRAVGWSCQTVADDRAALEGEIARLQGENATLKKALLDRGLALPGGLKPVPPEAKNDDSGLSGPTNREIDRMMAVVERVWRRLMEMIVNLHKDMQKKI